MPFRLDIYRFRSAFMIVFTERMGRIFDEIRQYLLNKTSVCV